MKSLGAGAALLLVVLGTAGCSSDPDEGTPTKPTIDSSGPYDWEPEFNGASVSKERFGADWPLTVTKGRVSCLPLGESMGREIWAARFGADDGTVYALNGTAKDRADELGLKDIDAIWADDPDYPGLKKDLEPLLDVCNDNMG